ncbi:MAG: hypothetical protein KDK51_02395 [Deltaproteobacteria bacterium]|nr:hypothetical protein [Deltaproteobacteria bacterium]
MADKKIDQKAKKQKNMSFKRTKQKPAKEDLIRQYKEKSRFEASRSIGLTSLLIGMIRGVGKTTPAVLKNIQASLDKHKLSGDHLLHREERLVQKGGFTKLEILGEISISEDIISDPYKVEKKLVRYSTNPNYSDRSKKSMPRSKVLELFMAYEFVKQSILSDISFKKSRPRKDVVEEIILKFKQRFNEPFDRKIMFECFEDYQIKISPYKKHKNWKTLNRFKFKIEKKFFLHLESKVNSLLVDVKADGELLGKTQVNYSICAFLCNLQNAELFRRQYFKYKKKFPDLYIFAQGLAKPLEKI